MTSTALPPDTEPLYEAPAPGRLMRLMWKAAGADATLLRQCTYGEQVKFFCLGGIVFATGLMAGIAGSYAIYTIFGPKGEHPGMAAEMGARLVAIVAGVIWGTIIFNLDRYIVASTGKGDGTDAITKQEALNALPRVILGVIIGLTISAPLEIRMFKPEIDVRLAEVQKAEVARLRAVIEANYRPDIKALEDADAKLRAEIAAKQVRADERQRDATSEMDGTGGSKHRSQGPIYQAKQRLADDERAQLAELKEVDGRKLREAEQQLAARRQAMDGELAQAAQAAQGLDGLSLRLLLAHEVAGPWVTWFIRLLFLAIELTPIAFKLMIIKGPYDYLEENVKEYVKARQGIELSHEYLGAGGDYDLERVTFHLPQQLLQRHKRLIEAQDALHAKLADAWRREHEARIDQDPGKYMDTP